MAEQKRGRHAKPSGNDQANSNARMTNGASTAAGSSQTTRRAQAEGRASAGATQQRSAQRQAAQQQAARRQTAQQRGTQRQAVQQQAARGQAAQRQVAPQQATRQQAAELQAAKRQTSRRQTAQSSVDQMPRVTPTQRNTFKPAAMPPQSDARASQTNQKYAAFDALPEEPPEKKRKSHIKRGVAIVVAVVVVVLVVSGSLFVGSVSRVKDSASTAMTTFTAVKKNVLKGDYDTAASKVAELKDSSDQIQAETSNPLWTIAGVIPVLGDDVKVLRTYGDVLSDCTANVLTPLTTSLQENSADPIVNNKGKINVSAINAMCSAVQQCYSAMEACAAKLNNLPQTHIPQVTEFAASAKKKFDDYNNLLSAVNGFAPVISDILGANGTRTYLVVAQNVVETRSTGGYVGAYGLLTVKNGTLTLGTFESPSETLGQNTSSSIVWTDEEKSIFDAETHLTLAWNVGYNPDIERCSEVWAATYSDLTGTHVDGVISAATTVVQDILDIAGEIELSDGTKLDGTNATKVLQHDLYWTYLKGANKTNADEGNAIVDGLFSEAAEKAFSAMIGSLKKSTMSKYMDMAQELVADREVFVWFDDDNEQALAEANGLCCNMSDYAMSPKVGVYFNAAEASKVGWYADMDTEVGQATTNANGTTSYKVTTTITNTATQEEASSGGAYIMGYHNQIYGDLATYLYIYAPVGATISDFAVSSGETFSEGMHEGHEVRYYNALSVPPGESRTITYTITCAAGAAELGVLQNNLLSEYR